MISTLIFMDYANLSLKQGQKYTYLDLYYHLKHCKLK